MSWLKLALTGGTSKVLHDPGAGPYPDRYDGPAGGRASTELLRSIFNDFEDGKAYLPSVGVRNAGATCAYCRGGPQRLEMVILQAPDRMECPYCRRQLAVGDPKEQRAIQVQPNPERERPSDASMPMAPKTTEQLRNFPSQTGPDLGS